MFATSKARECVFGLACKTRGEPDTFSFRSEHRAEIGAYFGARMMEEHPSGPAALLQCLRLSRYLHTSWNMQVYTTALWLRLQRQRA